MANYSEIDNIQRPSPFLRWAGGKKWLVKHIDKLLPKKINNYYEPFVGGGATYFHLSGKLNNAILSDLNDDLILTYTAIRDDVYGVIKELKKYKNDKDFYYKIRSTIYDKPIQKAAQFIFLNKTSFNGIYRVNANGMYNVPFGNRLGIDFIDEKKLIAASSALQKTDIVCQDFGVSLRQAKKNDLVFVDPPYTVAHENNGFIAYNQKLFTLEDQIRLERELSKLNQRGVNFIMTNAKHEAIKSIYKNLGDPIEVQRSSSIGGKEAFRGTITEYVFTNVNNK